RQASSVGPGIRSRAIVPPSRSRRSRLLPIDVPVDGVASPPINLNSVDFPLAPLNVVSAGVLSFIRWKVIQDACWAALLSRGCSPAPAGRDIGGTIAEHAASCIWRRLSRRACPGGKAIDGADLAATRG